MIVEYNKGEILNFNLMLSSFVSYILAFLIGLIAGSFLNCVIYRLEKGESFLKGRSYCPICRHQLSWQDLIPLLSFIFLGRRCRYCHGAISWQYPLVELITAVLFILIFWKFEFVWNLEFGIWNFYSSLFIGYLFIIVSLLIIIFLFDLKHYIIPDRVVYPAILIALIFNFQFLISNNFALFWGPVFSAAGAAGFFGAIVLFSRGKWMGAGDIKLAFLMGLFLSWPNILVALFLAFLLGSIVGIGLMLLKKKNFKSEIPFGPFLVSGTALALFWGENILNWYLNFFLIQ